MVFLDPFEVGEQQVHRHGASHLPNGKDPVFIPVADPKDGEVLIFQGGTWTTTNIQNVVNTYLSQLIGGLPLQPVTEEVTPVPMGVPPAPPSTPGGSDTQVQFNDSSAFGGDAGLTYNKTTNVLSVSDAITVGGSPATAGGIRFNFDDFLRFGRSGDDYIRSLTAAGLQVAFSDATALLDSKSFGIFNATPTWWNGAASVEGYVSVGGQSRISAPYTVLQFSFQDDDSGGDETDVVLDSAGQFYISSLIPGNTGSLGIAGKTWGNIFATLPTSDPAVSGQFWNNLGVVMVSP